MQPHGREYPFALHLYATVWVTKKGLLAFSAPVWLDGFDRRPIKNHSMKIRRTCVMTSFLKPGRVLCKTHTFRTAGVLKSMFYESVLKQAPVRPSLQPMPELPEMLVSSKSILKTMQGRQSSMHTQRFYGAAWEAAHVCIKDELRTKSPAGFGTKSEV